MENHRNILECEGVQVLKALEPNDFISMRLPREFPRAIEHPWSTNFKQLILTSLKRVQLDQLDQISLLLKTAPLF